MKRREATGITNAGHSLSEIKDEEPSSAPPPARKETMSAVFIERPGGPNALVRRDVNCPKLPLAHNAVLIKVAAIGVNRVDLDQRREGQKGPNGTSFCPGIECSGRIEAVGKNVDRRKPGGKIGDRVCAFLDNGGYAEKVVVPISHVLPVPLNVSLLEAACLPVAACSAWRALSKANIGKGKTILIHESCGDVAVFAIQMAKNMGAQVFVATDSIEKQNFYVELGADMCFNHRNADFFAEVQNQTSERGGVDAILDSRTTNLINNLESLLGGGVLIFVDFHGWSVQELHIGLVMGMNAKIIMLGVSIDLQAIKEVKAKVWPAIEVGLLKPFVYKHYPLSQAAEAHSFVEGESCIQRMISSLGPRTSRIQKAIYGGMLANYLRGKVVLFPDGYNESDLLTK